MSLKLSLLLGKTKECILSMLSCFKFHKIFNSLKVLIANSQWSNVLLIFFIATIWFVSLFLAATTTPYAPLPTISIISYFYSISKSLFCLTYSSVNFCNSLF